ncbi:MAG: DNA polymerase III subunit alpha [Chlamydiales bacterium]|nr:DNA polymerase III subunit alpha [Chlamydiales bacterium]
MSWIPLNVHSQFSILHSTASVKDLANKAQEYHIPALALTDFCNMFGAVDFYKAAISAQLKPIIGLEMMIAPTSRSEKKKTANGVYGHPITLLAKDTKGYQNLCKISSIGYLEGFYYTPRIDKEILSKHATGLICLSGSTPSLLAELAVKGNEKELLQEMDWFFTLFQDDFYFEIQNHQMMEEKIIQHGMNKESWLLQKYNQFTQKQAVIRQTFKDYSAKLGIECVATNDIKYIHEEDYKAQEILMNIQAGEVCELWERDHLGNPKSKILNPKREVLYSHEFYFKSPAQMMELFADFPQAVTNSKKIADKISFSFDFNKKFYPIFVPPSLQERSFDDQTRVDAAATYLRRLCTEAIPTRYTPDKLEKIKEKNPKEDPVDVVKNRLSYELDVIISKGLCDYLLIVYDFIFWAKSNKIPVGPGRGSGVGSIILYLIGVTDIEPLRFSLFFERFINPERLSYPDIDVDICMDRRQEVIDYTIRKYGKDRVAQIITFGTMKAKMAIKDVGRVLNVPLAKVNDIAKVVPEDLNITIEKALEIDPDFKRIYDTDEEAKRLIDFAKKVEGSIRNTGIHAAGLIICGDSLTDHIPVCNAKDTDILVTQFSMKPVEMVGMLKIDFLGLKTLTCIQRAVDTIQKHTKVEIDWVSLPLDDSKTFDFYNNSEHYRSSSDASTKTTSPSSSNETGETFFREIFSLGIS